MHKSDLKDALLNKFQDQIKIDQFDSLPESVIMNKDKIAFSCVEHGVFQAVPTDVLRKSNVLGCPKCNIRRREQGKMLKVLERFKTLAPQVHNNKFQYDYSTFTGNRKPMRMICPEHGEFWSEPSRHLHQCQEGGCKPCGERLRTRKKALTDQEWFDRAHKIHDHKYTYLGISAPANKSGADRTITYLCPLHGTVNQKLKDHTFQRKGCWECGQLASAEKRLRPPDEVVNEIESTFPGKLDFSKFEYTKGTESFTLICKEHNKEFTTCIDQIRRNQNFYQCPICNPRSDSFVQRLIADTLKEKGLEVIYNDRKILEGKEIDILLPTLKIGIEYNGVFWHSEKYMNSVSEAKWHKSIKQKLAAEKGISLFHFNSTIPAEKIINFILFRAGLVSRVFARKTKVSWINKDIAEEFLDLYHIQGAATKCTSFGLFFDEQLIGVASFSKAASERGNKNSSRWELRRMAFSQHVIGGASKLLKAFTRSSPQVTSMISYSDNRWFAGEVYEALGFRHVRDCPPDYAYTKNDSIFHKARFKHSCMKTRGDFIYNTDLPEIQNCHNNGYYRIWDCGKKKWELNLEENRHGSIKEHQEHSRRPRNLGEIKAVKQKRREKLIGVGQGIAAGFIPEAGHSKL